MNILVNRLPGIDRPVFSLRGLQMYRPEVRGPGLGPGHPPFGMRLPFRGIHGLGQSGGDISANIESMGSQAGLELACGPVYLVGSAAGGFLAGQCTDQYGWVHEAQEFSSELSTASSAAAAAARGDNPWAAPVDKYGVTIPSNWDDVAQRWVPIDQEGAQRIAEASAVSEEAAYRNRLSSSPGPVSARGAAPATVELRNLSRPSRMDFVVGESFEVVVRGEPNTSVVSTATQNGNTSSTTVGSTDSSGVWSVRGVFSSGDIGDWSETWGVGSSTASPQIRFTVAASAAAKPNQSTPPGPQPGEVPTGGGPVVEPGVVPDGGGWSSVLSSLSSPWVLAALAVGAYLLIKSSSKGGSK